MGEKLDRYECLKYLASKLTNQVVTAWAGFFEWPSLSSHPSERTCNVFFSSLGCTIPIGIGLAMALPHRKVIALVSDGDILMELGALPTLGKENPKNLVVFINDNENYQSVGGYPTMTHYKTDLEAIAKAAGVEYAVTVRKFENFRREVDEALAKSDSGRFIVMKTESKPYKAMYGTIERTETKFWFIRFIEETEGIKIFPSPIQDKRLTEKHG
jgi:thiamine pyrophosphate-dependent acetolactate synthase large subunit-like protein